MRAVVRHGPHVELTPDKYVYEDDIWFVRVENKRFKMRQVQMMINYHRLVVDWPFCDGNDLEHDGALRLCLLIGHKIHQLQSY